MTPSEKTAEQQLTSEGWTVFDTNRGFPDLFCIRNGSIRLVEVKRMKEPVAPHQTETIARLRAAGLRAEVLRVLVTDKTRNENSKLFGNWPPEVIRRLRSAYETLEKLQ